MLASERKDVVCPSCGSHVKYNRFCIVCGCKLTDLDEMPQTPENAENTLKELPKPREIGDSNLTMLVDYCRKGIGLIGGTGYTEMVLYRKEEDASYQLHYYSKYAERPAETHKAYSVDPVAAEQILQTVEESGMAEWKDQRGFGLCGAYYACKFHKDGEMLSITSDNMPPEGISAFSKVEKVLSSNIKIVRELFEEETDEN